MTDRDHAQLERYSRRIERLQGQVSREHAHHQSQRAALMNAIQTKDETIARLRKSAIVSGILFGTITVAWAMTVLWWVAR